MKYNLIYLIFTIFIYYIFFKNDEKNKYILSEVRYSGLANRINCISSSLLLSIMAKRKLLSIFLIYKCSISF